MNRVRIEVSGIVQGVGFRPFIYNLACFYGIKGFVLNDSGGVVIEAEGERVEEFINHIRTDAPAPASIEEVKVSPLLTPAGYRGFEIRESISTEDISTIISPDIATCKDCLRELFDPSDRRYLYPFINCTNCGPRYSIIYKIPYDRPHTTMKVFTMCEDCVREYHDPSNRRFHAQPNACPVCGPEVELRVESLEFRVRESNPIKATVELLQQGAIVAIKGLGGFHLACDATNDEAVRRLREGKRKSNKPFALMMPDIVTVKGFCNLRPYEERLLKGPERPIVLLKKMEDTTISGLVAPENNYLGVMLPYTPLHYLLFYYPLTSHTHLATQHHFDALVMTSGNICEEPIVTDNNEALERLSHIANAFLLHNRDIYMRVDDSVVRMKDCRSQDSSWGIQDRDNLRPGVCNLQPIRRARGYVPSPIEIKRKMPQILATGGELKTTFCLAKGRYAILSQHIGNMENMEAIRFYRETLKNLRSTFKIRPELIAHDLHPNYWTTWFARTLAEDLSMPEEKVIPVQHHHAHIASCMAEHGLKGRVIGVALDGTGYGTDGKVWGGEFLIADEEGFERFACLEYIPMPGGEKAIKEPYRMALSCLYHLCGSEAFRMLPSFFKRFDMNLVSTLLEMIDKGINSPLTSSCGRLFDAVSSLLGIRDYITFEGEAAVEMEMLSSTDVKEGYGFEIKGSTPSIIALRGLIEGIVKDIKCGVGIGHIAGKFHNTISEIVVEVSKRAREERSIKRVCLSGGCFQNKLLLEKSVSRLVGEGFDVFTHSLVPPNDGGIALGQAVVVASIRH